MLRAALLAAVMLGPVPAAGGEGGATLFHGGVVFTTLADQPDATWLVVRDGRFAAAGTGEPPSRWAEATRVDLRGRFVMPGFVDAHVHFVDGGLALLADAAPKATGRAQRERVAEAILAAQEHALAAGITAIGDDTLVPMHGVQYVRLADEGLLEMRVALRSEGLVADSRLLMRNLGTRFMGLPGAGVRYLGERFVFGQPARRPAATAAGGAGPSDHTIERAMAFAGPYAVAFHVASREDAERVVAASERLGGRRRAGRTDVLDGCTYCGGALVERIRAAGLGVCLRPTELHDLPELLRGLGPAEGETLLAFRALFRSGVGPALASGWPHGASRQAPAGAVELSPLASVAVVVSGTRPDGEPIPGAGERTVPLAEALRGITTYGAAAIGRGDDLGRIVDGALADFVVLPRSPFEGEATTLYRMEVDEVYIGGRLRWSGAHGPAGVRPAGSPETARAFGRKPVGWAVSPIIGYDPVPGIILGGAVFLYPYEESGFVGQLLTMIVPMDEGRVAVGLEANWRNVAPGVTLRSKVGVVNWQGSYYGVGGGAPAGAVLDTDPIDFEGYAGVSLALTDSLSILLAGRYGYMLEHESEAISAIGGAAEGPIDGHRAGIHAALTHDTRSSIFSPRFGGLRSVWAEAWLAQGSAFLPRGRAGIEALQFVPLYAPDLVLALRAKAGFSFGEPAYDTNFRLGGITDLRGYLGNRFRGHHYAMGTVELRYPIWSFVSGVAYGEAGMVWVDDREDDLRNIGVAGGAGLRFGLPPDFLVKLRFDVGFTPDQWGIFFAFDEAF